MAKIHGKDSVVQIEDSGGTLRTITVYVDNVDAPTNVDMAETSTFGQVSKSNIGGLQDTPISVAGPFDDGASPAAHAVISGLLRGTGTGGSAGYEFRFLPAGTASGKPRLKGRVLVGGYQVTSPVGGRVGWTANLMPATGDGLVWETI